MFKERRNPVLWLPFLVVLYFILHECNANFGLIPFRVLVKETAIYFLIALLTFAVLQYLFKKYIKAVLLTTLVICILLFFGSFHDFIKQLPVPLFFKRYVFLYALLIAVIIAAFIFLRKSGRSFFYAGRYLLITVIILTTWEAINTGINIFTQKADKNILFAGSDRLPLQTITSSPQTSPDIYFIVFDGYTSTSCLQQEFDYNNSELDTFLRNKGFYIVNASKSNYPVTPYSIASTLNFSYLKNEVTKNIFTAQDMVKGVVTIEHVRLIPYLEKKGYTIFNHSIFNLPAHALKNQDFFSYLKKGLLTRQTLAGRFKSDILWNFRVRDWSTGGMKLPASFAEDRKEYLNTNVYDKLNDLKATVQNNHTSPKFVYCHIMLPHEPYYFNRDGSFVNDSTFFFSLQLKNKYLNQLIFTTRFVKSVVDTILEGDRKNKIIILEGDHGFRDYGLKEKADRIFDNLHAIYFYDHNYTGLYNSMTPVNTFRVVLNRYFKEHLPYLPDTSIFINDPAINIGQ